MTQEQRPAPYAPESGRPSRRPWMLLSVALLFTAAFLGALVVVCSPWHDDEGFYMYAMRGISEGKLPYFDFFHNQPPLMILLFSPIVKIVGASVSVAVGMKLAMLAIGLAGVVVCWWHFMKRGEVVSAVVYVTLIALNLPFIFLLSTIKSYSLTVLFTACALYVLLNYKPSIGSAIAFGALAGLAGVTRLPLVPVVGCLALYYLLTDGVNKKSIIHAGAACAAGAIAFWIVLIPFFLKDPSIVWYNIVTVNKLGNADVMEIDTAQFSDPVFIIKGLVYFFIKATRDYGVILAIVAWVGLYPVLHIRQATHVATLRAAGQRYATEIVTMLAGAMIVGLHVIRPQPYNEYIAFSIPLLTFSIAAAAGKWARQLQPRLALGVCGVLVMIHLAHLPWLLITSLNTGTGKLPVAHLATVAAAVRAHSSDSDQVIMHQTLAFVADRDLVPGLEYPISSTRRDDEEAAYWKRINPTMYVAAFDDPRVTLALLPESAISPAVREKMNARFDRVATYDHILITGYGRSFGLYVAKHPDE